MYVTYVYSVRGRRQLIQTRKQRFILRRWKGKEIYRGRAWSRDQRQCLDPSRSLYITNTQRCITSFSEYDQLARLFSFWWFVCTKISYSNTILFSTYHFGDHSRKTRPQWSSPAENSVTSQEFMTKCSNQAAMKVIQYSKK
jgi:hypothetical protein